MPAFEVTLIEPLPEQTAAALSAAATGANAGQTGQFVRDDPEAWRKFAKRVAGRAEGWDMWRGGRPGAHGDMSLVTAGWWTDPLGRKHVAIRGRRAGDPPPRKEFDRRPALWHAYPDRCCLRHAAAGTQVVCHCACGAVGTPAALGWMGECCGPCFDRREEVGPAGLAAGTPGVLRCAGGVTAVACRPDGATVLAGAEPGLVVWDLAAGTREEHPLPARNTAFALTPDGRFLLRSGRGDRYGSVLDLRTHASVAAAGAPRAGWYELVPLADPRFALATHSAGYADRDLQLIRLPGGEVVRSRRVGSSYSYRGDSLVVSPDQAFAAFAGERGAVVDLRTWELVAAPNPPAGGSGGVVFAPDGARLYLAGGLDVLAYDVATWKRVAHGSVRGGFGTAGRNGEWLRGLVVNPATGDVLVAGGLGLVYVFDPVTLALKAALEWHVGPVNGMALAADGARLFTAGSDGCVKVWPLRELLS